MASSSAGNLRLEALPSLKPELNQRAWASIPHPSLPLLATCHAKAVTIYSLSTLSSHSLLTGGHSRSVRTAAWKPALRPQKLCLVTASFDSTAALWRWDADTHDQADFVAAQTTSLELDISARSPRRADDQQSTKSDEWEFTLVLEGHESEVKSVAFSPAGQFLATCSRDKSVWIWEDVGADEGEDEWETVAVLNEHDGDVKCVAWCPDVVGRTAKGKYGSDVLASSSYDNNVRIWREDGDGEWVSVAVLQGHEGTVWGVQWEPNPHRTKFPRLLSFSADKTVRVWSLKEEEEDDDDDDGGDDDDDEQDGDGRNPQYQPGLGGIPNTMRASAREEWVCTAVLPAAHTRDVYSATWSATTGLVASTGSDGVIVVYEEETRPVTNGASHDSSTNGTGTPDVQDSAEVQHWRVLTTVKNAHGPHEINHITWCMRFDAGSDARGVEEMLVTTGDSGAVIPWKVVRA